MLPYVSKSIADFSHGQEVGKEYAYRFARGNGFSEKHRAFDCGFELLSDDELSYDIYLGNSDAVKNLFMMTPYAYRTGSVGRDRALKAESLKCTANFRIFVYKKLSNTET